MSNNHHSLENKIRILFVEDDEDFRSAMSSWLKDHNCIVTEAKSAEEAVETLKKEEFDAVVSDIKLPGMDGVAFLKRARELRDGLPVILLTGYASLDSAKEAVRFHAYDYLQKPLDNIDEIMDPLQKAVHSYRLYSENKKLSDELRERIRELEESRSQLIQSTKMATIGQMASALAHEVKNPLGIIIQGVNLLERRMDMANTEQGHAIDAIKKAVSRADNIIRGLLDFSRPSQLELRSASIDEVISDSLSLVEKEIRIKRIKITRNSKSGLPQVLIDENQIKQVFINLFMNSFHAMKDEGNLTINTFVGEGNGSLVCEVVDDGDGISKENLLKVFAPFFTTKVAGKGVGLGLSVCKTIIDNHKGKIDIESENGRGTKVIIMLPLVEEVRNE